MWLLVICELWCFQKSNYSEVIEYYTYVKMNYSVLFLAKVSHVGNHLCYVLV